MCAQRAKKVYKCPHDQCPWEFSCASKLRRHLGSHTKQKTHTCPECGRGFKTWYNVQYHVRTIHQGEERPYKCPLELCNVACTSVIQLHLHFKTDHPQNTLFCCSSKDCYASFLSKDDYIVHQLWHKQVAGRDAAEVFTCDLCKAVLPTKSKLHRHRMFHMGEKHFRCPIKGCGHAYFTKQHLSRHLQQGDHLKGSIVNCPRCSRMFFSKSLLDHHAVVHSSNELFKCPCKSCDGLTICNEEDYCSHLMSTHSDTPWLPCVVTAEQDCKCTFPSKELQSLHHLLYHQHSSDTLKHLSSVKYDINNTKQVNSSVGSKEDLAVIRLIVRLYPYLRNFQIPIFDPYLASITLFINSATVSCSDLDRLLASLSLSEIETKATVDDDSQRTQAIRENDNINNSYLRSPSLATNMPSLVQLQAESSQHNEASGSLSKPNDVPSSVAVTDEDIQQVDVTASTPSSSGQRPLLLSMPLLTDLQPSGNAEQLRENDTMENNSNAKVTNNSDLMHANDTSETTPTSLQESYSNLMFLEVSGTASGSDNINDVFNTNTWSSSANNVASVSLDLDNPAFLSDDILDLASDSACVRDLMESVDLSYLLAPDLLESSSSTDWANLTILDSDGTACSSNETSLNLPNFAHLSNPLADLTFESLSAIPDSILESTLQMMMENSQSSNDVLLHSPTMPSVNKRGSSSMSNSSQKQKKALQLARV